MIYLFTEYNKISDELVPELINMLPDKRKKQALRFRYMGGKISCAVGYLMFLYGYRNLYKQNGLPDFTIMKNGKPYLNEHPEIQFNISHCNGAAACIFDALPVGIDIQDSREFNMRHVKRVCSEAEIDRITNANEPALEFCKIWSVKESISKLSGEGIFRDIRNVNSDTTNFKTFFIEPDKYMTATSTDARTDFTVHKLSLESLFALL